MFEETPKQNAGRPRNLQLAAESFFARISVAGFKLIRSNPKALSTSQALLPLPSPQP